MAEAGEIPFPGVVANPQRSKQLLALVSKRDPGRRHGVGGIHPASANCSVQRVPQIDVVDKVVQVVRVFHWLTSKVRHRL